MRSSSTTPTAVTFAMPRLLSGDAASLLAAGTAEILQAAEDLIFEGDDGAQERTRNISPPSSARVLTSLILRPKSESNLPFQFGHVRYHPRIMWERKRE